MTEYTLFSGSQKGNSHRENQDNLISRVIEWPAPMGNIYLVGVADGVTNTPYGGSVARWLANNFARDYMFFPEKATMAEQFAEYINILREMFVFDFHDNESMLDSASTLSVAAIQGSYAECFWAGDSPIFKSTKGLEGYTTERLSTSDIDPISRTLTSVFPGKLFEPHHKQVRLGPEDILTIATDGLKHNASSINDVYEGNGINQISIDTLIDQSVALRNSDDCTISAAYRTN